MLRNSYINKRKSHQPSIISMGNCAEVTVACRETAPANVDGAGFADGGRGRGRIHAQAAAGCQWDFPVMQGVWKWFIGHGPAVDYQRVGVVGRSGQLYQFICAAIGAGSNSRARRVLKE